MADGGHVKIKILPDDSAFRKSLSSIGSIAGKSLKGLMTMAAAIKGAGIAAAKVGVDYNAKIEQLQTSFEVMTGSAEKALDVTTRLREMGAATPFSMEELAGTTQLLMQYGFTADDALEKMHMLGDIAQGNSDAMTSIATGYAQMSSAGKVNLQDIKQMINGGFNPLQEISERTGESMESLYNRVSKGTMSIDEITESMRAATSEGGKFYQSMEKQSQTINGQLSTMKDNAMQLIGAVTGGITEDVRETYLPMVNELIGQLQTAFDQGGIDGLINAATDMIPNLLDMLTAEAENAISGLATWLPKGAQAIMKAVPGALSSAATVAPEIVNALFSVATSVITDLVAMLPQLLPVVLKGFMNIFSSVLTGVTDMIGGIFDGIDKAMHTGATKVAGVWVDNDQVAKFNLDANVDVSPAQKSVKSAYAKIREALKTPVLTDEQRAEIESMIGEDAETIKAKLIEFGVEESEAQEIAATVAEAGTVIKGAYDGLNISVDSNTVARWIAEADGSRLALKTSLAKSALTPEEQAEVIALFDSMTRTVVDGTPSIMEEIFDKLTDGKADDEETVKSLKDGIQQYISGLMADLDEVYQSELSKLDENAADYQQKKAELDEWYSTTKTEIESMNTEMSTLVDTLAGAPTAVVKSRLDELTEMESRLTGIETRIEAMKTEAKGVQEAAYNAVRAGARTDEETISIALQFKFEEFKLDEQAAEDAYAKAREDLLLKLQNDPEYTQEQFDIDMAAAEADRDAAIEAARLAYEDAVGQIFGGIAKSEGVSDIIEQAAEQNAGAGLMQQYLDAILDAELEDGEMPDMDPKIAAMLQSAFDLSPEDLADMDVSQIKSMLGILITQAMNDTELDASASNAMSGKIGTTYAAALQAGILQGTKFDTTDSEQQVAAVLDAIATKGAAQVGKGSEQLGDAEVSGLDKSAEAKAAAQNTIDGAANALTAAVGRFKDLGRALGNAVTQGYKEAQKIESPSKVMRQMGNYSGEGLRIGLQESMENAVRMAQTMSGRIATAADMSGALRIANAPELSAQIAEANAQNTTPVMLDGIQIAEIQGLNNSRQIAFDNSRSLRKVGSR